MASEYQIKVLENKLAQYKPNERGIYPSNYYALFNKIKALKKEMAKDIKIQKWNDFLAQ